MPPVLARTREILVVDKPAGVPVHAGRAGGPSVEDFFPLWRQGRAGPWLAHRLDQDTAGCLVIALKKSALLRVQGLFAAGAVQKTYWAVVQGVPAAAQGEIDMALAKQTQGRRWKMVPQPGGQTAVTQWRLLGSGEGRSVIEFCPKTGRTHQIRAHAAALGHPILGDDVYGGGEGRLQLLARRVELPLAPPMVATAPPPAHMRANLEACLGGLDLGTL